MELGFLIYVLCLGMAKEVGFLNMHSLLRYGKKGRDFWYLSTLGQGKKPSFFVAFGTGFEFKSELGKL